MKFWQTLLRREEISRYSVQQYVNDLTLAYNGHRYVVTGGSAGYTKTEDIEHSFTGYVSGFYKSNGIVFAITLARLLLFTEARFCWFDVGDNGEDGKPAGRAGLELLERPWPNAGTGELLARMEQDATLGGNSYTARESSRVRRLRPDWVTIVLTAPPAEATESDVAGYWYHPGRTYSNAGEPQPGDQVYLPDEICHWSPIPDPDAQYRGMSWLTPVVNEVMGDKAATEHKLNFFRNGATFGQMIAPKENLTPQQFTDWKNNVLEQTQGVFNAYRPLFMASPIDTSISSADMKQLDFKVTQGAGETRLCAAGGVPPIIVGLSEGLQSATYSNYGMARRKFGDHWARPQWKSVSTALSNVVEQPDGDLRLGVNVKDIAFLREDRKDQVEITKNQILAVEAGIRAGFKPDALIDAVEADDISLLKGEHTGLTSVQLLPPGAQDTDGDGKADTGAQDEAADDDAAAEYEAELEAARSDFLDDVDIERRRAFHGDDPSERISAGHKGGGRFRKLSDRITDAIKDFLDGEGEGDPLEGYTRPQLRKAAGDLGLLQPRQRATESQLKLMLLKHAKGEDGGGSKDATPDSDKSDGDGKPRTKAGSPERAKEDKALIREYVKGKSIRDLAAESGRSQSAIHTMLTKHGIQLRPRGGHEAAKAKARKAAQKAPDTPDAKEKAAVDRQARIDKVRGTAESVAEALELVDNEASEKALRHRINAMHTAGKVDEKTRDRMLAGVDVETENKIRAAYRKLQSRPNHWVMLTDLRGELEGVDREEVDAALKRLARGGYDGPGEPHLAPESNQSALTKADRDAAVTIGGQANHGIKFRDPSPRPGALAEVVKAIGAENDLHLTAETGDVVAWKRDSGLLSPGGGGFREGTKVRVFRPGVRFDPGDGEVVIADGRAEDATPEEIAEAKARRAAAETPPKKATPAKKAPPPLPPGVPEGSRKLTKAITGGPDLYEADREPFLYGVSTKPSGTAGFHTVHYNGRDKGDIKQAGDGSWQVWQNQAGIELGTKYPTKEAAAQAVAIGALPASSRWLLPRQSFDLYDADGNNIGGWDQHSGWKSARGAGGGHINLGTSRSTKTAAVKAILAHNERQRQLAAAREAAAAARRERLARAEKADANIAATQAVLYGTDPDATSPSRQLEVYGALDAQDFNRMDPGEQSAMLADLAFIATSEDAGDAARARQLIGWFTPAGTPAGMVGRPSAQAGIGPLNGTQNRFNTPRVGLVVLDEDARGQSGDGWFTGTEGSTRWGEYGAAGVLLRHVDTDGTERFLMVQRGPGVSDPGVWSFPGGAKDQNETFLQGGARELVEEMGLPEDALSSARVYGTHTSEAPDLMVPAARGGTETWKYVSIAADVDTQLQIDLTGDHTWETAEARWLTRDEIADLDNRGKLHRPVANGALQQNVMSLFPDLAPVERPAASVEPGVQPPRLVGVPARPRVVASNYTADADALHDLAEIVAETHGSYEGKSADSRLAAIGAVQGFNATPTVVSNAQFDELLATGDYVEVWRGVTDSTVWDDDDGDEGHEVTAAEIQEQLRSGVAFYGTGMYGNGYYFAEERSIADGYAGSDGAVSRALIPRSAAVAPLPEVYEEMEIAGARRIGFGNGGGSDADPIDGDEGRFAAARGWDGIRIDGYSAQPIYNIVNRSVLIVEEEDHPPGLTRVSTADIRPGMTLRFGRGIADSAKVASIRPGTAADTGEDVFIVTTTGGREIYLSPTGSNWVVR